MRALLVEDDVALAKTIKANLKESCVVDLAHTGEKGIFLADTNDYDIIILDLILPDMDGIEVCREIRKIKINAPIIMLTQRERIRDRVQGLDVGADDYLPKPFDFRELEARMRALTRRQPDVGANTHKVGKLALDTVSKQVAYDDTSVSLRRKEYFILECLMRNKGRVVSRESLLEHAWDMNAENLSNTIDVHIKFLRDKLDKRFNIDLIKTVHGLGYKIENPKLKDFSKTKQPAFAHQ